MESNSVILNIWVISYQHGTWACMSKHTCICWVKSVAHALTSTAEVRPWKSKCTPYNSMNVIIYWCPNLDTGCVLWQRKIPLPLPAHKWMTWYRWNVWRHYNEVIMSAMAFQITSLTNVYSTVYWGTDRRKHRNSAPLVFVGGIHRWPVNSPQKGPITWKMFPFDDVIMCCWCVMCIVGVRILFEEWNIQIVVVSLFPTEIHNDKLYIYA